MRCSKCAYASAVNGNDRKRCTLAAPLIGKTDNRAIALITDNDGCAEGKKISK